MANCNATTLLAEARQLSGLSEKQLDMAVVVLLQRWSENTDTASELLLEARCFQCLNKKQLLIAWAQLLCRTVESDTPFSYQPESATVSWVDENGSFSGTLSQLKSTADIDSITSITFPNGDVTSVSYLSALPVLSVLNISGNPIDSLDLSGCGTLTQLLGQNCQLAGALDLSPCTNLTTVRLSDNTSLTGLVTTGLGFLSIIVCERCDITGNVDLSPHTTLTYVDYSDNANLTGLDVSDLASLTDLYFGECSVSGVYDISDCVSLTDMECNQNVGITAITFPVAPVLTYLSCFFCDFNNEDLDLSACSLLTSLNCNTNAISILGVNTILTNLVTFGLDGGTANLSLQNPPAAPSGAGAAAVITLTGYPNPWTILTD